MNFDDIYRMHAKHGLTIRNSPTFLTASEQRFREEFLREELLEFEMAYKQRDMAEAADALIDLVVVAMGTAVMMGLPWHALWSDVLRANMSKTRGASARAQGADQDLIKPDDWVAPRSSEIIDEFKDGTPPPPYSNTPRVVTLCGSTRFRLEFESYVEEFTMDGDIVLSPGVYGHDPEVEPPTVTQKALLDQLHFHKIKMSDAIFVVNPGGYVGESTAAEIKYARSQGIHVDSMEALDDADNT